MTINLHCQVCDVAFALGRSEQQFYKDFESGEREQLIATYNSQANRQYVVTAFPVGGK